MSSKNNQSGFHIIELVLVLAIVGLVGYLGYTYYTNSQKTSSTAEQSSVANDVLSAPTIKTADDLVKAEKVLDDTNLDSNSDNSQIDQQLSAF